MDGEQNNTAGQSNENGQQEGEAKKFTQEEVNSIVEGRLAEERKKNAGMKEAAEKWMKQEEENKSELQKANERNADLQKELDDLKKAGATREMRARVAKDTGVPENLLTGDDEESCKKQAAAILEFAKPKSYPGTKENKTSSKKTAGSAQGVDSYRELARGLFGKGE